MRYRFNPNFPRALAIFGLLFGYSFAVAASKPHLFAVLVGLGNYNIDTQGFGQLDGKNDVRMMHEFLTTRVDCAPQPQIFDLTKDSETTKANIEKTVQQKLIDNPDIHPGDIVVLFYSGHGTQVVINGKTKQAIVPIDVRRKNDNHGEIIADSTIAGPEIGAWIKALLKKTNNVTFIFDSCTSATITRGAAIAKAGNPNPAVQNGKTDPIQTDTSIGPAVVFSAALTNESAYQSNGYGNLTTALIRAANFLSKDSDSAITYEDLKNRLDIEILSCEDGQYQHPQIQGGELRRKFLGSVTLNPPLHMDVGFVPNKGLIVRGGELRGLARGVVLGLYHKNETDYTKPPVATARVVALLDGDSSLKIAQPAGDPKQYDGYWAIVVDGSPSGMVTVCLDDLRANPKYVNLAARIGALKFVTVGDLTHYDCRITPPDVSPAVPKGAGRFEIAHVAGKWTVSNSDGSEMTDFESGGTQDDLMTTIKDQIINASRYKSVKALKPDGEQPLKIEMKLVKVQTAPKDYYEQVTKVLGAISDPRDAPDQQRFGFAVRAVGQSGHPSPESWYVAVLDLMPKRAVEEAWPDFRSEGDRDMNAKLPADGKWYLLGNFGQYIPVGDDLQPPDPSLVFARFFSPATDGDGEETFKLLATDVPQAYKDLMTQTKERGDETNVTPLGKLIKLYSTGEVLTRRGALQRPISSFSMATVSVQIKK